LETAWKHWESDPYIVGQFEEMRKAAIEAVSLVNTATFRRKSLSVQVPGNPTIEDISNILCAVARIESKMVESLSLLAMHCSSLEQSEQQLLLTWKAFVIDEGFNQREAPEWRVNAVFVRHTDPLWGRNLSAASSYHSAWTQKLEALRRIANRVKEAVEVVRGG
jgi:hypothetical protein